MSAIAQYLQGTGVNVSGSDRFFNEGKAGDIKEKLEAEGIKCFPQNGEGITTDTDLVVVSTAIEDTVIEVKKAKELGIPIIRRSELLALIAATKKNDCHRWNKRKEYNNRNVVCYYEACRQKSICNQWCRVS